MLICFFLMQKYKIIIMIGKTKVQTYFFWIIVIVI